MINERKFISLIRNEYKNRLLEALSEVEIVDGEGNILISPDLKVRHKKSGYEYTVDDIIATNDEDIQIVLRAPEDPRFVSPGSEELLGAPPGEITDDLIGETEESDEDSDETVFVVDKKDFEEDYEVK